MRNIQNEEFFKSKKIEKIKICEIHTNEAQPRTFFDQGAIEKLAESIKQNGLLQPLSVRKVGREYRLIAGERRLRALKFLGETFAPCIVVNADDLQSAVLAITENVQRQDLNIFEEAEGIALLIDKWNVTQEEAAKRLGMSQPSVANKLRLLKFTREQREIICKGKLTERHARAVLRISDLDKRNEALKKIIASGMNVVKTEKYVENILSGEKKGTTKLVFKDIKIFINTINMAIETMKKAGIAASAKKGENENFYEYIIKIPKQSVRR